MRNSNRSLRFWLLPFVLLLLAGAWWLSGSVIWGGGEDGINLDEDPAGKVVAEEAEDVASKEALGRGEVGGSRTRVVPVGGEEEGAVFGIEGTVVDVLGKGLPGVRVSARGLNELLADGPKAVRLAAVVSGADGGFRLEGVRGTRLFVLAERDGGDFGTVFLNRSAVAGWIRDVRVVVLDGSPVRGRVLDQQGQAIEGAWVLPTPIKDGRFRYWRIREQRSDAEGRFGIGGLPRGGFCLSVWAPGYRLGLESFEDGKPQDEITIRLRKGRDITLGARIEAEPQALARLLALDPRVRLTGIKHAGKAWLLPSPFGGLRFGQDGRCRFEGLVSGELTALLLGLGQVMKVDTLRRRLEEGTEAEELVWRPKPLLPLEVQLIDEGGRPVPGIELVQWGGRGSKDKIMHSDVEGRIRMEGFAPKGERSHLQLLTPGWYFDTRQGFKFSTFLSAGLGQTLELGRGPSLSGTVLGVDGKPAQGAEVILVPVDVNEFEILGVAESDRVGRFQMTPSWPKQPTRVRLGASLGRAQAVYPAILNLRSTSRLTGFTLRLQPGAILEGRLVLPDGQPVSDQTLDLQALKTDWKFLQDQGETRAVSDSQGRFRFEGIPPGKWRLRVPAGKLFLDRDPYTMDLDIGERRNLGRVLLRTGLSLAGKFLDLEGKPHDQPVLATASRLGSMESSSPLYLSKSAMVALDGQFQIEGLSRGTYNLQFQWRPTTQWSYPSEPEAAFPGLEGMESYQIRVEAGSTDLEFRVPKPGFGDLEVRILPDGQGWLPGDVHVGLQAKGSLWLAGQKRMPLKEGMVLVRGLRAGRYRLRIQHPRFGRREQDVLIQRGQNAKVLVDLGKLSGRIDVRVRDEQGQALPGAWVGLLPLVDNKIEIDDPWGIYWSASRVLHGELKSDAQGQALLLADPRQEDLVMVWKPGFVPFARPVRAGGGPIQVTLRKGPELLVRIAKETLGATDPAKPWAIRLRLLQSAVKDRDPRLDKGPRERKGVGFILYGSRPHRLDCLPPGRYLLEGDRPGARRSRSGAVVMGIRREFRLEAGKPMELDL